MISIEKRALPHLSMFALTSAGFFVGVLYAINSAYKVFYKTCDQSECNQISRNIFTCCAWLGLAGASAIMANSYKEDFFDVEPFRSTLLDFTRIDKDIQQYQIQIKEKSSSKGILKWFCFGLWESALVLHNIDKVKTSYFFSPDPILKEGLFKGLNIYTSIKNSSEAFINELKGKEDELRKKYEILKESIKEVEFAKGLKLNFNWICSSPFYILDPSICNGEKRYQNNLDKYGYLISSANYLKNFWISDEQLNRCKENYRIKVDYKTLLSEETLKEAAKKL